MVVFRLLPKDRALESLEVLDVEQQQDLIQSFAHEQAAAILWGWRASLAPSGRVAGCCRQALVRDTSPEDRRSYIAAGYAPETAGAS